MPTNSGPLECPVRSGFPELPPVARARAVHPGVRTAPGEVIAVEAWLHGQGLARTLVTGFAVDVTATASPVSAALGTRFQRYGTRRSSGIPDPTDPARPPSSSPEARARHPRAQHRHHVPIPVITPAVERSKVATGAGRKPPGRPPVCLHGRPGGGRLRLLHTRLSRSSLRDRFAGATARAPTERPSPSTNWRQLASDVYLQELLRSDQPGRRCRRRRWWWHDRRGRNRGGRCRHRTGGDTGTGGVDRLLRGSQLR